MFYHSHSHNSPIDEHISTLEDLYAECFKDEIEYYTLFEIHNQIKKLRKKAEDQKRVSLMKKKYKHHLDFVASKMTHLRRAELV